jgi:hypothetical protein
MIILQEPVICEVFLADSLYGHIPKYLFYVFSKCVYMQKCGITLLHCCSSFHCKSISTFYSCKHLLKQWQFYKSSVLNIYDFCCELYMKFLT